MTQLPSFIRGWTAPFFVSMGTDIKDAKGCWICEGPPELVELMNFAARTGEALNQIVAYRDDQPAGAELDRVSAERSTSDPFKPAAA